jgi:sugar lactone lactonase YvrE
MDRSRFTLPLVLILICTSVALGASQSSSAIEQFQGLKMKLRSARKAGDWNAFLIAANQQKDLLNGAPDSLLEVARAQVHTGDIDAALRSLKQFVNMGQSTGIIATLPDFAPILKNAETSSIRAGMEINVKAVSLASTAFDVPDSGLLAEDVDYDPGSHRFFVTSVREKKIVVVKAGGASSDFASAADNWPMLAIKVDAPHRLVWATEVALQGFDSVPKSDWGKSALLCYDLATGKLIRRIEGPPGSALGDMALTPNGDVIVSDGEGGGVYRLPAHGTTLRRIDKGDFISPQTPVMHPDGRHIFVPDYLRGIGVLEIATGQVRWLSMGGRFALNGIDGLYFDHGRLIAVQNGTSPERVVLFTLDASLTRIESEMIIEQSTPTLGDPTHGVVIDGAFYYIANSGWDSIDDVGNLKPGAKLSEPRMMRATLQPNGSGPRMSMR